MDTRGRPSNFYDKAKFLVEIDGMTYAGFQTCSDISVALALKSYSDGASPTPFKKAGKEDYPNITLEQGVSENTDLEEWFRQIRAAVRGYGVLPEQYKRNVNVVEIDEMGSRIREISCSACFIVNFNAGAHDANDKEGFVIKSIELAYDEFEVYP